MDVRIVPFGADELALTGYLPQDAVRRIVESVRGCRIIYWNHAAVTIVFNPRYRRAIQDATHA